MQTIAANTPDSWYHSKKMLYAHLNDLAQELGYPYVLDGMIMDDLDDFRPGMRARTEAGARSVTSRSWSYLSTKFENSRISLAFVWDKPASCSLSIKNSVWHKDR